MSLNKTVIIHKHSNKCGGIGDFLRASLSFYSLCKKHNFYYYIDFSENINLGKCFDTIPIPKHIYDNPIENLNLIGGLTNKIEFKKYLDMFENIKKVYIIKCNLIGFESNDSILNIKNSYCQEFLKPNEKVLNIINNIYTKYNIKSENYVSVHLRTGDKNIEINDGNITQNRRDIKYDISDSNIKIINNYIKDFINTYKINIPVVIHSDSVLLKKSLSELNNNFIILDLNIKHIAEDIGLENEQYYLDTIAEFYLISQAREVLLPYHYSGFSHLASILGNKPIYTNCANAVLLYIGNKYIKFESLASDIPVLQKYPEPSLQENIQQENKILNGPIYHMYYINLENRNDRNLNMIEFLKNFEKFNIGFTRINAYDGNKLDIDNLVNTGLLNLNVETPLRKGQIGCALSHFECWKTFSNSNNNYGIFFEDDIVISQPYFNEIIPKVLESIPNMNFDLCFLSFNSLGGLNFYQGKIINDLFYKMDSLPSGAHAYILSRDGCKKIQAYYNKVKLWHPLDFFYRIQHDYPRLFGEDFNFISVKPDFLYHNNFDKNNFVYQHGKEFPIYAKDFSDSDTSKIK